jgi:hypothetical protein
MLACARRADVMSMLVPGRRRASEIGWRSAIGSDSIWSCVTTDATSVRVVSTTGASPVTVTVSWRA